MSLPVKPSEGSWTEHYPELGTGMVSYEDSTSPEFYELERDAIWKRAWLNVGRVEQLPRNGSYFTKELAVAKTSIIVVRGLDGEVRAFHNICRHRGNKLVWQDYPREETSGSCRQFVCKYHGWQYDLDGGCTFVQQESEFFDLDKADYGLVPVHCDVWAGFIFVNLDREPTQSLRDFLGPHGHRDGRLPVRPDDRALVPRRDRQQLEDLPRRVPGVLPRVDPALAAAGAVGAERSARAVLRAPHYQIDGPHRVVSTSVGRACPPPMAPERCVSDRARHRQRRARSVGAARCRTSTSTTRPA